MTKQTGIVCHWVNTCSLSGGTLYIQVTSISSSVAFTISVDVRIFKLSWVSLGLMLKFFFDFVDKCRLLIFFIISTCMFTQNLPLFFLHFAVYYTTHLEPLNKTSLFET